MSKNNVYILSAVIINPQTGERLLLSEIMEQPDSIMAVGMLTISIQSKGFALERHNVVKLDGWMKDPNYTPPEPLPETSTSTSITSSPTLTQPNHPLMNVTNPEKLN